MGTRARLAVPGSDDERRLLKASRARLRMPLAGRERAVTFSTAGAFVLAAAGLATAFAPAAAPDFVVLALLLGAYTVAARIEFEVGPGSAVPTQLILVPALLLLPPVLVPPIVAAGYILSGLPEYLSGRRHPDRMFVALASSWHALGPAVVLTLAGSHGPVWGDIPLYLLALGAQFALDTVNALVREWFGFRVTLRRLLGALSWVFLVDALLAPAGFLAALASLERRYALVLVLPLLGLFSLLAADRKKHIGQSLAASEEARSDPLTGLNNRLAWEEELADAQAAHVDTGQPCTLMVIDLDRLKQANDTRGHDFGDRLIRVSAGLLRSVVPSSACIARIGGDEFAVLVPGVAGAEGQRIASRLAIAFQDGRELEGFALSASVGSASCPPASTVWEAVQIADARLYEAKAA